MNNSISVIVPTYNSVKYLKRLLESIRRADKDFGLLEVLVIDDSRREQAEATMQLCGEYGAIYCECPGNVAVKRNHGSQLARFDIMLFVDSDCEVTTHLLAEHSSLAELPADVGAMIGVVEFVGADSFVWRAVERSQLLGPYSFAKRMEYAPWGGAGNLSVRRQAYAAIGGFDINFLKAPGGEDVDLGIRLNKSGYRIRCNPRAIMHHTRDTWQHFWRMIRRSLAYGRGHYHVLTKHADKTGVEYPRPVVVTSAVALALIVNAIVAWSLVPLGVAVLFFAGVMLFQAAATLFQARLSPKTLHVEVVGQLFDFMFDGGILLESLLNRDIRGFYRKMIYSPHQLVFERDRKVIQMWSLVFGFMVILQLLKG